MKSEEIPRKMASLAITIAIFNVIVPSVMLWLGYHLFSPLIPDKYFLGVTFAQVFGVVLCYRGLRAAI